MKISEVITLLEKSKLRYGDSECYCLNEEGIMEVVKFVSFVDQLECDEIGLTFESETNI
jgi:hypothetical protein